MVAPEHYKEEWKKWNFDVLPMFPNAIKFQVSKNSGAKKQFSVVKRLLEKADFIVVATDADREGENIARSIIEKAGAINKPIQRLWINSLVVDEVRKGFQELRNGSDFELFYQEAQTRQISDWLVGMNASRLYTLLLQQQGMQGVFSVGRVQTPTLFQIYSRQEEINHFQSKPFFEVFGDVEVENGAFEAKDKDKFSSKKEVEAYLQECGISEGEYNGFVQSVEKEMKKKASPKLYTLSSLQSVANKKWKYSPTDTLSIVQELYEKKLLSYPRTDTPFITESEFAYLKDNIESYKKCLGVNFDNVYTKPRKRYVNNNKVQEHYAIIPTKQITDPSSLSEKQRNIYLEVMRTTVAMFHDDFHYEETKVEIEVKGLVLTKKGNVTTDKGWNALFKDNNTKSENESSVLPPMKEEEFSTVSVFVKEGATKPPKPYTEGGLINMMKNAGKEVEGEEDQDTLKEIEGIGTEATRANVIETLKKHQYIEVKKNVVYVTNKGVTLCRVIDNTLLASPEMTAKWEQYLAKISAGEGTQKKFLETIKKFISSLLEDAPKSIEENKNVLRSASKANSVGDCPSCDDGLIDDKGKFYGCSNYRNGCTFTLPKQLAGKTLTKTNIADLMTKGKTSKVKGFKSKKGKKFDASLKLVEGKVTFDFGK